MSCSKCGSKGRMTFQEIISQDGSSLPTLKYLHCKHKEQFEALFASIGVNANESNLPLLALAHDSGADKRGELTDSNNRPIYFCVEDILRQIDITKVSNSMCAI